MKVPHSVERCWRAAFALVFLIHFQPLTAGANILPVGAWYPDGDLHDVRVAGTRAYHAAGAAGLLILDVTDPGNPLELGSYRDPAGEAVALAVKGDYALVAFGARELQIINIADPAHPIRAAGFYAANRPDGGSYGEGGSAISAHDLILDGNIIYLADGVSGLQIVDVSDPINPNLLSFYVGTGSAHSLRLESNVITLESFSTVEQRGSECRIDVSNPRSPLLVSPCGNEVSMLGVMAVASSGTTLYEGSYPGGFETLDVTVPSHPIRLGRLPASALIFGIAVEQSLALVANYSAGAQIIDVSNPADPKLLGTYPPPSGAYAYGVAIAGTRGYVAVGDLHIIDLSVPASPKLLGVYKADSASVTVSGNLAFLAGWDKAEIVNIEDPAHPAHLADLPVGGVWDIAIQGQVAYLAGDNGLSIFKIADPSKPTPLGHYTPPDLGRGLAIRGAIAYLGANTAGVLVLDVHNPGAPKLLGSYDTAGYTTGIAASNPEASGSDIFAADGPAGVKILRETFSTLPSLTLTLASGIPTMQIRAIPGKDYVLEWNDDPASGKAWTTLNSFTLQSNPQTIEDHSFIGKMRFYRVREA